MGEPVVLIRSGDLWASEKNALAARTEAFGELEIEVVICGLTEDELCA